MRKIQILIILLIALSMLLSACGGPTPTPDAMMDKPTEDMMMEDKATPDAMMDKPTEDMMMEDKATPDAMMDKPTDDMMADTPDWFGASLTNVRTGEVFTINDFKGKVVLVETMAVWCSNCLKQQGQVKDLHALIGENNDFISIGLDIDPNENAADLKNYVEAKEFDWLYAVAPAQVSAEIGNLYTQQFLNPPSTPILIVDRHGVAHPLPFGIKSAEDLAKAVNMYLNEGM